jgi:GWxTD domain-containing protein
MRIIILTALLSLCSTATWAIEASVRWARFAQGDQPYVECYVNIGTRGLTFLPQEGDSSKLMATVEAAVMFKQNGVIVQFDRLTISSPVSETPTAFLHQSRYALAPGTYEAEVWLIDAADTLNQFQVSETWAIETIPDLVQISDIQLLLDAQPNLDNAPEGFVKQGFVMKTLPHYFVNKNMSQLMFYAEIYNARVLAQECTVQVGVYPSYGGEGNTPFGLSSLKKKPSSLIPFLHKMDVSTLPSGNYTLVVTVRDTAGNLIAQREVDFQRSNPYLNLTAVPLAKMEVEETFVDEMPIDTLKYSLRAIMMQVSGNDSEVVRAIYNGNDVDKMRQYLLYYWLGVSPNHPEVAYKKYMTVVAAVEYTYQNGFGYGFESDRGWMFLKYGKPDDITRVENDPSAPPYEIWTYFTLDRTNQRNVRFVFWNPSLVANGHRLLHSTARGELNNPRWQVMLYQNAPKEMIGNSMDATEMMDNWGRNAGRIFNDQ